MSKIDDFKKFVNSHSEFVDYVKKENVSWQKLYELYDIYGENSNIWDKYLSSSEKSINIKNIFNSIKNINLDSLEENINSIQKAVGLVEEFTKTDKKEEEKTSKREEINSLYSENENEHNSTK
jgi:hypothetical protein